ncbi:hypothetical protein BGZ49_003483 [Haplosporangium sp. Z 27]|nr:hypothetical protein BGZ49_003483 [Haplosporangium sp. Z 27]
MATNSRQSSRLAAKATAKALESQLPAPVATPVSAHSRKSRKQSEAQESRGNMEEGDTIAKSVAKTKTSGRKRVNQKVTKGKEATEAAKEAEIAETTTDATDVKKAAKKPKATKATRATKSAPVSKKIRTLKAKTNKALKSTNAETPTRKTKAAKKKISETITDAGPKKRSRGKKDIINDDTNINDEETIVKDKKTRASRKRKVSQDDEGNIAEQGGTSKKVQKLGGKNNSQEIVPTPQLVNRTDPCTVFPIEVWHQILRLLPLSAVAKISTVSKSWLDGSHSFPAWKIVCESNRELGQPAYKYRSFLALACSKSVFLCDKCYSFSHGKGSPSDIPLPIPNKDDDNSIWNLCLACRLDYYQRYPEPLHDDFNNDWQYSKITKTDSCSRYYLSETDLIGLYYQERPNPHYRRAFPMKLYDRQEVQKLALRLHGGWIGISAANNGVIRQRNAMCKLRDKTFAIRKPSSKKKNSNKTDSVQATSQSIQATKVVETTSQSSETSSQYEAVSHSVEAVETVVQPPLMQ